MYVLTTNYSFDSEVPAWLFATYEEACAELERQFKEELRIQTEENEHVLGEDLETSYNDEWSSASIIIDFEDPKDVMTWTVSEVKTTLGLGSDKGDLRNAAEQIIEGHPNLCDAIYRAVWKQRVKEDTLVRIKDAYDDVIPEDKRDEIADDVAERYVYEGDYECNQDYWSNLDNVIEDVKYVLG